MCHALPIFPWAAIANTIRVVTNKIVALIKPYGGKLKELYLSPAEATAEKVRARDYPSWDMTPQQLCDVELLLNGGFSPLEGFMGRTDYECVLGKMRLSDGTLWPVPITLEVDEPFAQQVNAGDSIALRDATGALIAVMEISDLWLPGKVSETAKGVDANKAPQPVWNYEYPQSGRICVGGKLKGFEPPGHYDFSRYRNSPTELRALFQKMGWRRIVALQTTGPLYRAHMESVYRVAEQMQANLLIQPVVGEDKPGDNSHYSRVRCYEHIVKESPEQMTALSLLPLASRYAGPREAMWRAIICRNYGCTHLVISQDHIDLAHNRREAGSYDRESYDLVNQHQNELGVEMVPLQAMAYVQERSQHIPVDQINEGETILNITGAEFRSRLDAGLDIPAWFSYQGVVEELRKAHPPHHKQGFTLFLTGLSGAGKSTIANALTVKLMEIGGRSVSLLDGDIVRKHLSSELGFSREHRNINILRIGYVASEITKSGGIAICAPIAPYAATRREVRNMISPLGGFVEVYVATPLETCEERDRKGLYAKARAGLIKEFTGISDPYEAPENPELTVDTRECTPDEAVHQIILKLEQMGFIKP